MAATKKNSTPKKSNSKSTSTKKKTTNAGEAKDWFSKGDKGFEQKRKQDAIASSLKEKGTKRFWMPQDSTKKLVFLDTEGFFIREHDLKVNGKWGRAFVTCVRDFQACGVCDKSQMDTNIGSSMTKAYFTVIDTSEYEGQDGTKYKNQKVLYPAKGSTIQRVGKLREKHGDLTGLVFNVTRYGEKDPNCGTDFEYVGKLTAAQLKKLNEDPTPYDYMKLLAPPTDEELANLGFASASSAQSDGTEGGESEGMSIEDML